MEGFDFGGEVDGLHQVAGEEFAGLLGGTRVGLRGCVGEDGELGFCELGGCECGGEGLAGIGDERAVEGGGDGEHAGAEGTTLGLGGGAFNLRLRAGDDELRGGIAVRDDEVGAGGEEEFGDDGFAGLDGEHAAAVGGAGAVGHEASADVREAMEGVRGEAAGGAESNEFAVAVASGGFGREAEVASDFQRAEAHGSESGLGDVGGFQGLLLGALGGVGEGGVREDEVAEARGGGGVFAGEGVVRVGQGGEGGGELAGEVAEHPDVLRALAGEERGDFAASRTGAEGGAVGEGPVGFCWVFVERRERGVAEGGEGVERGRDACPTTITGGRVFRQREEQAEVRVAAEGLARGVAALADFEPRKFSGQGGDLRPQFGVRGGGEREDFHIAIPTHGAAGGSVFLEHDVEVRAAEAERAHARAARMRVGGDPRALRRVDVEGRDPGRGFVERLRDLDGGGENFVVEGERGLDEAGDSGGGFRVADLRLHRAERGPSAGGFRGAKNFRERTQLGGVADLRAGAVGFD